MFEITYHRKIRDDISVIATSHNRVIKKAIEEKLTRSPELFGKPLQFSLKGLRTLRVGDYRIVFQLKRTEVFIILIAHRSVVYKLVNKRV